MTGKQKCEFLKSVRKKIAELNGIEYNPQECTHDGPCSGSCLLCEMEAKDLFDRLLNKEKAGEKIQIEAEHLFELDQIAQWTPEMPEERKSYIPELCGLIISPDIDPHAEVVDFELDIK